MTEYMDLLEIDIANIKNIKLIHYYNLIDYDSNSAFLLGLIVIYEKSKVINLCSFDKYFDRFEAKTYEIYKAEKDVRDIITDNFTLDILKNHCCDKISSEINQFSNTIGYNRKIINYKSDNVKVLQPIIFYFLKKMFSYYDTNIEFFNNISGYRERFVIHCKKDGIDDIIPFTYKNEENNCYIFRFGNIFGKTSFADVQILYSDKEIMISAFCSSNNINWLINFNFQDKNVNTKIYCNNLEAYNKKEVLLTFTDKDIIKQLNYMFRIEKPDDYSVYKLPWGEYCFLNEKNEYKDNILISIDGHEIYITVSDKYAVVKEIKSKYIKISENDFFFKTDCININRDIYLLENLNKSNCIIVQTHFPSAGYCSSGEFKSKLEGRTFYQVCECNYNSLSELNSPVDLQLCSKDLSGLTAADILDLLF